MMSKVLFYKIKCILVVLLSITLITACSHVKENIKRVDVSPSDVPFSITFDRKGDIMILDEKGERIRPSNVDFPVKAEEIVSMNSINAIMVKGSCFWIVQAAGKTYHIPLPDSYCG